MDPQQSARRLQGNIPVPAAGRSPRATKTAVPAAFLRGGLRGVAVPALNAAVRIVNAARGSARPLKRAAALARVQPAAWSALAVGVRAEAELLAPYPHALGGPRALTLDGILALLPYDVAVKLLALREATMRAFFDTWAKSLAENAKRDREASERATTRAEQVKRAEAARIAEAQHRAVVAEASRALAAIDLRRTRLAFRGRSASPTALATVAPSLRGRGPSKLAMRHALALNPARGPQLPRPRWETGVRLRRLAWSPPVY